MDNIPRLVIPADPMITELQQIKQRQKDRKVAAIPKNITNDVLYQMLSDTLENQARLENKLNRLLGE